IDVNERKINQFLNGIYKSSVEVLDNHRNEMAMKLLEHYEKGDESDNIDSYLEDRKIPI
ncbi:MAG: hypothetical protein GWN01_00150, partial [Nitrosopumilaceae archaeon]|nr:hypothetical protein [Nitrosopumilaceae archaeon]NIU85760.1 hypothetical protein [Nitrosopumilaceae archaeon]NIV64600.1 hypothetical protein [Nitrosopumilaceae archaeon]NIX60001.1 hypothetical protein [Nitrosopumilaceae archaeon]